MNRPAGDYRRTHVYAAVDYEKPKYLFQVIADSLKSTLTDKPQPRLLDVGGASGALAGYLKHRFADARVCSLDFDQELCDSGRHQLPDVEFVYGDANNMEMFVDDSFDAVTMVGTMGVFDDFEPSLSECLRLVAPKGTVIVAGQFNNHPVDALIRYRYSGEENWNTGYNLFSRRSISSFLERQQTVESFEFTPFELPFDLAPQDDPIRSWTEKTADGRRELRNGLNLIIDMQILTIKRSEDTQQ